MRRGVPALPGTPCHENKRIRVDFRPHVVEKRATDSPLTRARLVLQPARPVPEISRHSIA
jgi:hypothetical protein